MVWSDPTPFVLGQRMPYQTMNLLLRDNLLALKNPPSASYLTIAHASDYSTSSTSFGNVDATNLSFTISTAGDGEGGNGDVMLFFCGTLYSSTNISIYFRWLQDGVTLHADDGLVKSLASGVRPISAVFLQRNVSAGSHTYTLQWKVSGGTGVISANAGTSGRDARFWAMARELS